MIWDRHSLGERRECLGGRVSGRVRKSFLQSCCFCRTTDYTEYNIQKLNEEMSKEDIKNGMNISVKTE